MHYLVTGHTGFKGAWLTLLLQARGHTVSGLALDPEPGALFEVAGVGERLQQDHRVDIRDADATRKAIVQVKPDAVIHMAAQALVRESYREPRLTYETNAMGTMNVLEAVAQAGTAQAMVVITTDKVYRNVNQSAGYVEDDPLGGDDPYSASKAMADIMTASWVKSFPGVPTAIARAGNVIGGGDVCKDRLLVDLLAAYSGGRAAQLRMPQAVRPWQHVLDCVNGYLVLTDALLAGRGRGAWNFGPGPEAFVTVGEVATIVADLWGGGARWEAPEGNHPHEAGLLALDASKARRDLGWYGRLGFRDALEWTVDWTRRSAEVGPLAATQQQIDRFERIPGASQ